MASTVVALIGTMELIQWWWGVWLQIQYVNNRQPKGSQVFKLLKKKKGVSKACQNKHAFRFFDVALKNNGLPLS